MESTVNAGRRALLALAASAAALLCVPAQAAPGDAASREEARGRFERGRELFEDGDYAAALAEFRRAYELAPNYRLLYNVGQVCFQVQDYPCALQSFTRYLADGGADIAASRVSEVQRDIDRLRTRVARIVVSTSAPGAEVAVDDVPVGKTPFAAPILVSAGRRRISAALAGHAPASKTVEIAGMESAKVDLELARLPSAGGGAPAVTGPARSTPLPPGAAEAPIKRTRPSPWFWAGPAALAAGGISFGIAAQKNADKLQSARYEPGSSLGSQEQLSRRTKAFALTSDLLNGAAVASAAVLAAFILFGPEEAPPPAPSRATLELGLAPNGLAVAGRF